MQEQMRIHRAVLSRGAFGYLALLLAFASISTDLYLPAMPTMAKALGASQGAMEWTVSGYLLGFAIGQLFWGPLSDHRGRRVPLAMGLVLFMVGALGCGLATNVVVLIAFRVVQAVGASACVVIGRAIVADLYQGEEAARVLSTLTAIMVIAPMVGPLLGARILAYTSWPVIFFILTGVGLATLLMLFRVIPETLPPTSRLTSGRIINPSAYWTLRVNKRLLAYAIAVASFTAGVFAYVAGSSFVFISYHGLSPDLYGLVFAAGSVAIIAANMTNARLVGRVGSDRLMLMGLTIAVAAALAILGLAVRDTGVWLLIIVVVIYIGSNGFVSANAISGGLNTVTEERGRASAFLGFSQYGGGMIGSAILGILANGTVLPFALILLGTSVISLIVAMRLKAAES